MGNNYKQPFSWENSLRVCLQPKLLRAPASFMYKGNAGTKTIFPFPYLQNFPTKIHLLFTVNPFQLFNTEIFHSYIKILLK